MPFGELDLGQAPGTHGPATCNMLESRLRNNIDPMNDRDLMFLSASKQRQMILDRKISSVEMTKASLRRIERIEPELHAFITIDEEGALAASREADTQLADGSSPGPLHGVPIWWYF